MHLENTKTKHVRRFFLRGEKSVFQRKQESYMRKWHSKEDRKRLEQICMSFPKMCSSLDRLVYLEMLGRAAAQKERAALAQPVMALSCLEMWQLWASLSQWLHCPLRQKEEMKLYKPSKRFSSSCKSESISLYNKLAVPAITNWNGRVCKKKILQI